MADFIILVTPLAGITDAQARYLAQSAETLVMACYGNIPNIHMAFVSPGYGDGMRTLRGALRTVGFAPPRRVHISDSLKTRHTCMELYDDSISSTTGGVLISAQAQILESLLGHIRCDDRSGWFSRPYTMTVVCFGSDNQVRKMSSTHGKAADQQRSSLLTSRRPGQPKMTRVTEQDREEWGFRPKK